MCRGRGGSRQIRRKLRSSRREGSFQHGMMVEVGFAGERKEGVKGPFSMLGRGKGKDGGWHGEDVGRSRFSAGKERAEKSEAILPSSFKVTGPATSKRP